MDSTNYKHDKKISKIIPYDLSDISFEELQLFHSSVGNAHIPNKTIPPDEATSITNQSYAGIGRTTSELGISPAATFAELDKSGLKTNSSCTQKIWNYETNLEGPYLNLPNYQSKDIKTQEMISSLHHIGSKMYWETHPTSGISNDVSSTPVEPTISNPTRFRNFASTIEDSNIDPKYFQASGKQRTVCQRTTRSCMQELQNSNADGFTHFYKEDARSRHGQVYQNFAWYVEDSIMNPVYFQASDKQRTVCQRTTGSSIRDFQNYNADGFTHFYGEDARSNYGQVSQNFASHIMNPMYFQAPDKQRSVCQRTTCSSMKELQNSNADGFTHFYEEDARSLHGQVFVEAVLNNQSRVDASIQKFILPSHIRSDLNLPSTIFGTSNKQMECNDETNTFRCELCGKTFTKSNLISHYIDKHGLKSCSECGERFYDDSYLQKHMRFHSEERRFQCLKCKKRFKSKTSLKSHYLVHLRNILFKCEKCPQTFTDKGYLKIHEKYFHL